MNLVHLGDTEPALEAAEATRRIGGEISDPRVATYGTLVKGYAYASAGAHEASRSLCEESVRLAPERISRAYASAILGYSHLAAGDAGRAIGLLEEVVESFAQFPFPQWEGLFGAKLAEARLCLGDLAGARIAAEHAVEVTEACGFRFGAGWARRTLGKVATREGRLDEASKDLDRAREIFTGLGAKLELARMAGDTA